MNTFRMNTSMVTLLLALALGGCYPPGSGDTGNLLIAVEVPLDLEEPTVAGTLSPGQGEGITFTVEMDGPAGTFERSLESGRYRLSLTARADGYERTLIRDLDILPGETITFTHTFTYGPAPGTVDPVVLDAPIVADHRAVLAFDALTPLQLKDMADAARGLFVSLPGRSHATGFMYGLELLEDEYRDGDGTSPLAVHLNASGAPSPVASGDTVFFLSRSYRKGSGWDITTYAGDVWTHRDALDQLTANLVYHRVNLGMPIGVFGWMWCWDMTDANETLDDSTGWAGKLYTTFSRSESSAITAWDIDSTAVNLGHYFTAMETAARAEPGTVVFFITGTVDRGNNRGAIGYQRWRKNEAIRDYVAANKKALLDYEDILSWDYAANRMNTEVYNGTPFPVIHPAAEGNFGPNPDRDESRDWGGSHISEEGTKRIAKALWWMLARIGGWEDPNG